VKVRDLFRAELGKMDLRVVCLLVVLLLVVGLSFTLGCEYLDTDPPSNPVSVMDVQHDNGFVTVALVFDGAVHSDWNPLGTPPELGGELPTADSFLQAHAALRQANEDEQAQIALVFRTPGEPAPWQLVLNPGAKPSGTWHLTVEVER
jgi:hypothetical protein